MRDGSCRLLLVVLALGLAACSDDPTEQNALLAPLPFLEVAVRETTITAIDAQTFRKYVPMNGRYNLVGQSDGYTAYTAMSIYSNLFPTRDTITVVSAQLSLRAASFFGDSSAAFGFTVHRIERNWNQVTATWDSMQSGFYDPSVLRGEYSGGVGADTEMVSVELDTVMAREWFRSVPEGTTVNTKFGFILIPSAGTGVVRGFHSFDADSVPNAPSIRIISVNATQTVRDTMVFRLGIDTFAGNVDGLEARTDLLSVQAGVVYRSILNFDASFLGKGTLINKAELLLDRDPLTSRLNRFSGDSAIAVHTMFEQGYLGGFEALSATSMRKAGTSDTYVVDARRAVQAWAGSTNYGILLRIDGEREFQTFDLVTFHSPSASSAALRPRLKILYSVPKN